MDSSGWQAAGRLIVALADSLSENYGSAGTVIQLEQAYAWPWLSPGAQIGHGVADFEG